MSSIFKNDISQWTSRITKKFPRKENIWHHSWYYAAKGQIFSEILQVSLVSGNIIVTRTHTWRRSSETFWRLTMELFGKNSYWLKLMNNFNKNLPLICLTGFLLNTLMILFSFSNNFISFKSVFHYVKSVQNTVRIRKNKDQKKLPIWALLTQCL